MNSSPPLPVSGLGVLKKYYPNRVALSMTFLSGKGCTEEMGVLGRAGGLKNSRHPSSSQKKATSPPRRRITEE
jgi:hypothetical protein